MTTDDRLEEIKDKIEMRRSLTYEEKHWLIAEVEKLREEYQKLKNDLWFPDYEAAKDEIESLRKQLAAAKDLKRCGCQYPNLQNTGGSWRQCSHCGGWQGTTIEPPLCEKCGELYVSIPRMGIGHVCNPRSDQGKVKDGN